MSDEPTERDMEALGRVLFAAFPFLARSVLTSDWYAEREAERDALAAAVDRVRRRHPRGDEESGLLAPGKWCPTCGRERSDGGYGACPDRLALAEALTARDAEHEGGAGA